MSIQDLYETIVETTGALIIVLDPEGRIVRFNPACERVSGYRFEEVKARHIWDFLLLPEETEGVKAVFRSLARATVPSQYANHWITKSGERRWIEWSNSAVADERGQVVHVIGTGVDVTDRRDAEAELREGQERFQELASAVPLVLWIRDPHSNRVLYVSPGFETIWGRALPDADTAFEAFRNSIHPDDREAMFRQLQKEAESGELGESEYRIVRPDGEVRWIHSHAFPVKDHHGKVSRIVGYAEDVTDRKRTEQALYEVQQRQKALLNAIPDSVWLTDAEGRYVEANRRYGERWGFDPASAIGKTVFDLFPASIAEGNAAEDREVLRTGKPLRTEKHCVIRGREHWLDVMKAPVTDEAGHVIGIAGTSRDITERKLAEARRMAHDAAQRDALVKEVHHRIKNNLQGVITLIQQLASKHPEIVDVVDAAVTRLDSIASVYGLLGITGEREPYFEQVVLNLVSSLTSLHADLPVRLSVRNPVRARVREIELVPLALIVNELIMNAVKHSQASRDGSPVEVVLEGADGCAHIAIRSPGGRLPRHFDFDAGACLGTGLSLVKSLLPPEGARLRFRNTADLLGTEVELTLRPPVIALALPAPTSAPSAGPEPELGTHSDR